MTTPLSQPTNRVPADAGEARLMLSPQNMFEQLALENRPLCAWATQEPGTSFEAWKAATWPRVLATLGDFPLVPDLDPVLLAEWEHDGLRKQRWYISVHQHIGATLHVNYPGDMRPGETRGAIFCWHGHGPFGKDAVMLVGDSEELHANVKAHNYSYGHEMAKQGFITYAIDWLGGGERDDASKPNHRASLAAGRDWCNLYYLHATMLGMTSLSINVTHGKAATDFICTLPGVDPDRLGVMGLSGGGTMALWSGLCDERFKAIEIICYSDLWPIFGMRDINYCGMQVAPGLFKLVNLHDLQGLLAPRPLLVDIAAYDDCFKVDGAMVCYRGVQEIYAAAGAEDKLELDLFPGGHAWGNNKAAPFFNKYLNQ